MTAADVLPEFHHRERHAIAVDATPERALAAAKEMRVEDVPVLNLLIRLRGLRPGRGSLWHAMTATSFRPAGDDTLVAVGKPWLPRGWATSTPGHTPSAISGRGSSGWRISTTTQ